MPAAFGKNDSLPVFLCDICKNVNCEPAGFDYVRKHCLDETKIGRVFIRHAYTGDKNFYSQAYVVRFRKRQLFLGPLDFKESAKYVVYRNCVNANTMNYNFCPRCVQTCKTTKNNSNKERSKFKRFKRLYYMNRRFSNE